MVKLDATPLTGPVFIGTPDGGYGYKAVEPLTVPHVIEFGSELGDDFQVFTLPPAISVSVTTQLNSEQAKFWKRIFRDARQHSRKDYFMSLTNDTPNGIDVRLPGWKRTHTITPGKTLRMVMRHGRWEPLQDIRIERKRRRVALRKKRNRG